MVGNNLKPHIVIVGGGAGGLELATRLGNTLGRKQQARITLVDSNLTHLWKPLWHEAAAGTLNPHEEVVNYITHGYKHNFSFEYGSLQQLDRAAKKIILAKIADSSQEIIIPERCISYDLLVIAIGSVSNNFNTPGVQEHCIYLDARNQVDFFQQQFLRKMFQARYKLYQNGLSELNIAIIGAGATGVELAAELNYAISQAARYSRIPLDERTHIKISLIEAADRILANLPERVAHMTLQQLQRLAIQVHTSQRVKSVSKEGVVTVNGLFIPANLKIWAAGIKAPALLTQLDGLAVNKLNQLLVTQTLQTTIDPCIFALGDCASCPQPNSNHSVPPRAQAAHQQAKTLFKSILRYLQQKPLLPYYYRDYGSLISLSRKTTVGNLMSSWSSSVFLEGKLARTAYLWLYRRHQITLHGFWRALAIVSANFLTRAFKPQLKLH